MTTYRYLVTVETTNPATDLGRIIEDEIVSNLESVSGDLSMGVIKVEPLGPEPDMTYAYVVALRIKDTDGLSFRHTTVTAKNRQEAYDKGFQQLQIEKDETRENDYVFAL